VNTIVNDHGDATEIFVGDWKIAHESACAAYAQKHTISVTEKRGFVIASCGGFPFDLNMIQAHKTLEAATHACAEGGNIILLAECADGLGRSDFLKWFEATNSQALAEKLSESYQVNGQTAWNLLRIAETFKVHIITNLRDEETRLMHLQKARSIEECISKISRAEKGFIIPSAARGAIKLSI
jgi:nickel-dependent lactate racemase